MQTEKVVFCKIQFLNFSSTTLEAKISGAKIVEFKEDVKAVTYHEAKIEKNSNGFYETNLVFDI
jgi:SHS2 domain-containing protein